MYSSEPEDLITISWCICDNCQLLHKLPTHNVEISKALTHNAIQCWPSALSSENWNSSIERTLLQNARCVWRWTFVHSRCLRQRTATQVKTIVRMTATKLNFPDILRVCAEILWFCKPNVESATQVAGHRQYYRVRRQKLEMETQQKGKEAVNMPPACSLKSSNIKLHI